MVKCLRQFYFISSLFTVSCSQSPMPVLTSHREDASTVEAIAPQGPPVCLGMGNGITMSTTASARNVLGTALKACCLQPITGFYRTGTCETGPEDQGTHTVCSLMTQEFLDFTKSKGNDLTTPLPQFGFPGLVPGQRWCLCARRWLEAAQAGRAPRVDLEATHYKTLDIISLELLKGHALSEN